MMRYPSFKPVLIWACLLIVMIAPPVIAAFSPYLAYRTATYIVAGFAGIAGLSLLVLQPLLSARALPSLTLSQMRRAHRATGLLLTLLVILHVGGLYLVSPPDTLDALTFQAPTWFSVFGVIAMWSLIVAAFLGLLLRARPSRVQHSAHHIAATILALTTIAHALLIEGAMEPLSKYALCLAVLAALVISILRRHRRSRAPAPRT